MGKFILLVIYNILRKKDDRTGTEATGRDPVEDSR